MYILFGLMMTLLAVTHVVSHVKFQYWPTSVKLFSASLVLRAVSLACGAIHFCALGINGTGSPFFESVGTCVGIVASFSAFVWAGWIATGGLNSARPGLTTLAVAFLILNFCSYVGLFAWYELGRAPWSTDYVFDSGFGVVKKTNAVCYVCVIATTFPRSHFYMEFLSSPFSVSSSAPSCMEAGGCGSCSSRTNASASRPDGCFTFALVCLLGTCKVPEWAVKQPHTLLY